MLSHYYFEMSDTYKQRGSSSLYVARTLTLY